MPGTDSRSSSPVCRPSPAPIPGPPKHSCPRSRSADGMQPPDRSSDTDWRAAVCSQHTHGLSRGNRQSVRFSVQRQHQNRAPREGAPRGRSDAGPRPAPHTSHAGVARSTSSIVVGPSATFIAPAMRSGRQAVGERLRAQPGRVGRRLIAARGLGHGEQFVRPARRGSRSCGTPGSPPACRRACRRSKRQGLITCCSVSRVVSRSGTLHDGHSVRTGAARARQRPSRRSGGAARPGRPGG